MLPCVGSGEPVVAVGGLLECRSCHLTFEAARLGVALPIPEHEPMLPRRRVRIEDLQQGRAEMHFSIGATAFHALCPCGSQRAAVVTTHPYFAPHLLCCECSAHLTLPQGKLAQLDATLATERANLECFENGVLVASIEKFSAAPPPDAPIPPPGGGAAHFRARVAR